MKIAIIGYATEGRVNYEYFTRLGHEVTICNRSADRPLPEGAQRQVGEGYLDNLDRFDLIVRSAGIHPDVILGPNPTVKPKITTAVNEFLKACPTRNTIGVTGTKGKGTTSTLITKILEAAGKQVYLGGNIGRSPLEFMQELTPESWVVLELSSYQLHDIQRSPHMSVCLMIVPEHLNWHKDMDDYVLSKAHIFEHQESGDIAIYYANSDISKRIAAYSPGIKIPYYAEPGARVEASGNISITGQKICHVNDLQLIGKHNWQNVCAAITVAWQIVPSVETIRKVVTAFTGLPHRLELVRETNSIKYYNDSFASGLLATEAAIAAIPGKKIVIVGGYDRMLDLEHFPHFLREHPHTVKHLLLIGASQSRLAAVLDANGITNYTQSSASDMKGVVADANKLAASGDSVILSPGFASFDMFKDFEDRGIKFKEVVMAL